MSENTAARYTGILLGIATISTSTLLQGPQ